MNTSKSEKRMTHFAEDNAYPLPATDEDTASIGTASTRHHHYSRWSQLFKKDHHGAEDDDDRFTSASTVINHSKDQRFSLLRTWWSSILGDIYKDDNPKEYSQAKKNIIIFIVALSGISGPIGSMIYMPGLTSITMDLNASLPAINGTVSAYVIFLGIAPLFWASMSDTYGRKPMYICSLFISIIASVLCAISSNVTMLIVFRAIQACGASSGQTLGAGVIADTIDVANRGKAYGVFYIGPLLGPVIGPTIGGLLCDFLGWQSTFYFLAIIGAVLLVFVTFLLPETLRRKREEVLPSDDEGVTKPAERFKALKNLRTAFKPMIAMLGDPTVLVITLYNTIIFASLYFLTPTITDTFQKLYHFTSWQIGLCYLVFGVGLMFGSVLGGRYSDFIVKQLRKKKGPENVYPEMRLKAAFPSFVLIPAGYLIYAWTTQKEVGVYGPLIGLFVYALGQMSAFTPTSVYLVDSKPGRSASAVAINNCVRSIVGAITTIISSSCVNAVGTGVLFTILAAINIVNTITVLLVMAYGRKWRTNFERKTGTESTVSSEKQPASDPTRQEQDNEYTSEYLEELAIVNSRLSAV